MLPLLIVAVLLLASLLVAIVICCQKRRWGFALAGLVGQAASGYAAVAAVVAQVTGDSGGFRLALLGHCGVLLLSLAVTSFGARSAALPNSLWARHGAVTDHGRQNRQVPTVG